MKYVAALLVTLVPFGAGSKAFAESNCDLAKGATMIGDADSPWTMQIELVPTKVPLNAPFDVDVTVCSQSDDFPTRITVDATMPAHKHGMNYVPKTARTGDASYTTTNLLFHMPGMWRVEVTAYGNDKPYRFTHDVDLR